MRVTAVASAFLSAVMCASGCASMARFNGRIEPVEFYNGPVRLVGILLEPEGSPGPFPAVVFIHGSGPSTYDRPAWKAHANVMTSRGFAVLVYNKRGSPPSTGHLATSDYQDLAQDVIAGVRYLRARRDIVSEKIGLFGRSEGGWVGSLAGAELGNIAFVIMSSGAAVSPYDQTLYAVAAELKDKGAADTVVTRAIEVRKRVWDYYRRAAKEPRLATGAGRDSLSRALESFAHYRLAEMPAGPAPYDSAVFSASTRMRFYDALPALMRLNAPLLALLGENDKSVNPLTTIAVLDKLKQSEHKDITVKVFPGADHTLLSQRHIPPGYVRGYLQFVADWAVARVR